MLRSLAQPLGTTTPASRSAWPLSHPRNLEAWAPSDTRPNPRASQYRAWQPSLPWVPPILPQPLYPATRDHIPAQGCWISLYLLQPPLPLEQRCPLSHPTQDPFPGLPGSPPPQYCTLPPPSMPAAGTLARPPGHSWCGAKTEQGWGNFTGGMSVTAGFLVGPGLELALEERQDLHR